MSNEALVDAMNLSSAALAPDVDEFEVAGLTAAPSRLIKAPWVAQAPAAFECRLWKTLDMPANKHGTCYTVVIGEVVGVHINDAFIRDGLVDTAAMRPLARMGYMDYSVVTKESSFTLNRPTTDKERRTAAVQPGPWDGVYR
jgi:flavin reductase (DIM6/NTAB) family NADH-FMN oxidoreductase RutF